MLRGGWCWECSWQVTGEPLVGGAHNEISRLSAQESLPAPAAAIKHRLGVRLSELPRLLGDCTPPCGVAILGPSTRV